MSFFSTMSLADPNASGMKGASFLRFFGVLAVFWVYGVVDAYVDARRRAGLEAGPGAVLAGAVCLAAACPLLSSVARSLDHKYNFMSPALNGVELGKFRSALSVYFGDANGAYPDSLDALTAGGKYVATIPEARGLANHPDSARVHYGNQPDDAGGWWYDNIRGDRDWGLVAINCTHTDTRGEGRRWSSY